MTTAYRAVKDCLGQSDNDEKLVLGAEGDRLIDCLERSAVC